MRVKLASEMRKLCVSKYTTYQDGIRSIEQFSDRMGRRYGYNKRNN